MSSQYCKPKARKSAFVGIVDKTQIGGLSDVRLFRVMVKNAHSVIHDDALYTDQILARSNANVFSGKYLYDVEFTGYFNTSEAPVRKRIGEDSLQPDPGPEVGVEGRELTPKEVISWFVKDSHLTQPLDVHDTCVSTIRRFLESTEHRAGPKVLQQLEVGQHMGVLLYPRVVDLQYRGHPADLLMYRVTIQQVYPCGIVIARPDKPLENTHWVLKGLRRSQVINGLPFHYTSLHSDPGESTPAEGRMPTFQEIHPMPRFTLRCSKYSHFRRLAVRLDHPAPPLPPPAPTDLPEVRWRSRREAWAWWLTGGATSDSFRRLLAREASHLSRDEKPEHRWELGSLCFVPAHDPSFRGKDVRLHSFRISRLQHGWAHLRCVFSSPKGELIDQEWDVAPPVPVEMLLPPEDRHPLPQQGNRYRGGVPEWTLAGGKKQRSSDTRAGPSLSSSHATKRSRSKSRSKGVDDPMGVSTPRRASGGSKQGTGASDMGKPPSIQLEGEHSSQGNHYSYTFNLSGPFFINVPSDPQHEMGAMFQRFASHMTDAFKKLVEEQKN
eukprot:gnl/Dysnectes_brevis/1907_a2189_1425.p1 GENE.gnl/Dysnectes_brevis/1907_a2189_1425~~gnl/Dysnectes_brevis/1907_a2189_1425.p1  ORF type:complete len:564 (+),score=129.08 gnl/Dysnectes_brevis/1907_a2189_1425:40-1692(+)